MDVADEALRLEDVSTVYEGEKRPAIRSINLTVKRGELVYVIGPNGAGKTTLLDTINGLLPPSRGKISVFRMDLHKNARRIRSQIGYMPQDFMVNPDEPFTALDVVLMGRFGKLGLIAKPTQDDLDRCLETMKFIGIEELAERPMGKLSGGQQQKVMIARALAKEPRMLLLDEPFSNLDPDARSMTIGLVEGIHEERRLTTLIVTHETNSLADACRRVVVMMNGEVLADANPEEAVKVLESPLVCSSRVFQ